MGTLPQFNEGGRCKCSKCGRVFGGLSAFDAHHTWIGPNRVACADPLTIKNKRGEYLYRIDEAGIVRSIGQNPWGK